MKYYIYKYMTTHHYLNLYRNAINSKYWGLHTLINNIISDTNIHQKQIGGKITKFTVDNQQIKADVVYNKDFDDISIQIINLKGKEDCGVIVIYKEDKTTAIIQNIKGMDNCYESTIDKTNDGKIIMKLLIELCKSYKIKKILLADNSVKKIDKFTLELPIYYTMIRGYPWYVQFGFNNSLPEENLKINNNYNKLRGKKVKDYDRNIFIDPEFIKFTKDNQELSIKSFIKSLSFYNIEKFNRVYQQIYLNLKLERLNNKEYYLEL